MTHTGQILVGVPVYQAWEFVAETLHSLQAQTFEDFSVLLSVDGNDEQSVEACRPWLADPRFRLEVQRERLGWVGNINWLLSQARHPFFCYYPHDDVTDPGYFAALIEESRRQPAAGACYCDVRFFGDRSDVVTGTSILGDSVSRVLAQLETLYFGPFRGLVRQEAVRATGLLRLNGFESFMEDVVWTVKLARHAEMRHVPKALLHKRWHPANASRRWGTWGEEKKRDAWITFCAGLLGAALPAADSADDRFRVLFKVLDRLARQQWYYVSENLPDAERRQLALDFFAYAERQAVIDPALLAADWLDLTRRGLRYLALE
jgi:GT2 family glycosyltransferase